MGVHGEGQPSTGQEGESSPNLNVPTPKLRCWLLSPHPVCATDGVPLPRALPKMFQPHDVTEELSTQEKGRIKLCSFPLLPHGAEGWR